MQKCSVRKRQNFVHPLKISSKDSKIEWNRSPFRLRFFNLENPTAYMEAFDFRK